MRVDNSGGTIRFVNVTFQNNRAVRMHGSSGSRVDRDMCFVLGGLGFVLR